jgi:hypothetical protein
MGYNRTGDEARLLNRDSPARADSFYQRSGGSFFVALRGGRMTEWEETVASIHDLDVASITIEMPRDVKDGAEALIAENQWGDVGLLRVFATGLAFLKGEKQVSEISSAALDASKRADAQRAVKLLLDESSRFATLRFKAYRMADDNQTLSMRAVGWQRDAEMLAARVKIFREDEDGLRARILELESENARLRQRALAAIETPIEDRRRRRRWSLFSRRDSA